MLAVLTSLLTFNPSGKENYYIIFYLDLPLFPIRVVYLHDSPCFNARNTVIPNIAAFASVESVDR
jgi:hypothetical protein